MSNDQAKAPVAAGNKHRFFLLICVLVCSAIFLAWQPLKHHDQPPISPAVAAPPQATSDPAESPPLRAASLVPFLTPVIDGITRRAELRTIIPGRPRVDVITYTVQKGDTLFSIADHFRLKPETLLWGNYDTLKDSPHMLSTEQKLFVLPTNGAYYRWKAGDSLGQVADYYSVQPQSILDYPGNHFDLTKKDQPDYGLQPGDWLIIPEGKRPIKDWGPPAISRNDPAAARYYGDGSCGNIYQGAIGTGTFVWPTTDHNISGYPYNANIHPALDIGGALNNPVYAVDSGVVVFSGWSNYGYGNMVVIDHGNGWQSAYAHLNTIAVTCGQSLFQGSYIGGLGTSGNSSGPHLHFELSLNGAKPNPMNFLK
jgi:murein DD-endopeptidase MepM/ murein hydrolase activator NlpD